MSMKNYRLIRTKERFRLRHGILPVLVMGAIYYFADHAVYGPHGFFAMIQLRKDVVVLEAQAAQVREMRERLDHQVSFLRPESVDPDLLDERVRASLGYVSHDDIKIYRTDK